MIKEIISSNTKWESQRGHRDTQLCLPSYNNRSPSGSESLQLAMKCLSARARARSLSRNRKQERRIAERGSTYSFVHPSWTQASNIIHSKQDLLASAQTFCYKPTCCSLPYKRLQGSSINSQPTLSSMFHKPQLIQLIKWFYCRLLFLKPERKRCDAGWAWRKQQAASSSGLEDNWTKPSISPLPLSQLWTVLASFVSLAEICGSEKNPVNLPIPSGLTRLKKKEELRSKRCAAGKREEARGTELWLTGG